MKKVQRQKIETRDDVVKRWKGLDAEVARRVFKRVTGYGFDGSVEQQWELMEKYILDLPDLKIGWLSNAIQDIQGD